MTPAPRILAYLIATLVALVILVWLWRPSEAPPAPPPSTATATTVSEPTPTLTPLLVPAGYRLSGVAVGGVASYAAIETPGGSTGLYRLNADVPGLGRIVRIEGERVVVRAAGGEFEMWVAPAPTPSYSPTRRFSPRMVTPTPARTPSG